MNAGGVGNGVDSVFVNPQLRFAGEPVRDLIPGSDTAPDPGIEFNFAAWGDRPEEFFEVDILCDVTAHIAFDIKPGILTQCGASYERGNSAAKAHGRRGSIKRFH